MPTSDNNQLSIFSRFWLAIINFWCLIFVPIDRHVSRGIITPFTDIERNPRPSEIELQRSHSHSKRYGLNLHVDRPVSLQRLEAAKEISHWKNSKAEFLRSPSLKRSRRRSSISASFAGVAQMSPNARHRRSTLSSSDVRNSGTPQIFVQDWDIPGSAMFPARMASFDSDRPLIPPRPKSPTPSLRLDDVFPSPELNLDDTIPSPTSSTFSLDDDSVPLILLKERRVSLKTASPKLVSQADIPSSAPMSPPNAEALTSPIRSIVDRNKENERPICKHPGTTSSMKQPYRAHRKTFSDCTSLVRPSSQQASTPLHSKRQSLQDDSHTLTYADVFDLSSYTGHQSLSFDSSVVIAPTSPLVNQSKGATTTPDKRTFRHSYGSALFEERFSSPPVSPDASVDTSTATVSSDFCFGASVITLNDQNRQVKKASDFLPQLQSSPRRSHSVFVPSTPPNDPSSSNASSRRSLPLSLYYGSPTGGAGVKRSTVGGVVDELQQAYYDFSFTDEMAMRGDGYGSGMDEMAWRRVFAALA